MVQRGNVQVDHTGALLLKERRPVWALAHNGQTVFLMVKLIVKFHSFHVTLGDYTDLTPSLYYCALLKVFLVRTPTSVDSFVGELTFQKFRCV